MEDTYAVDVYITNLKSKIISLQEKKQVGSILWYIKWYQKRYPWRRRAYRAAGLLTLIIALVSPLWISQAGDERLLLAGIVVFLSGLVAFFSWKAGWSGYYLAQLNLTHQLEIYDLKINSARYADDSTKSISLVDTATEELLSNANKIINDETKGYFSSFKFPVVKTIGK